MALNVILCTYSNGVPTALTKDRDRDRIFLARKELGYSRIIILRLLNRQIFREEILNAYDKAGPC